MPRPAPWRSSSCDRRAMKRAAIFLVLILVLGGAGAAGWWFMLREPPAETAESAPPAEAGDAPRYVDVDPVTVPVFRDGRVVQHMSFVVVLQVDGEDQQRVVYKSMRRLTDAYIRELHVLLSRRFVWQDDDIVPLVRKRLMAASARVVGREVVAEVLVKGIKTRTPQPT